MQRFQCNGSSAIAAVQGKVPEGGVEGSARVVENQTAFFGALKEIKNCQKWQQQKTSRFIFFRTPSLIVAVQLLQCNWWWEDRAGELFKESQVGSQQQSTPGRPHLVNVLNISNSFHCISDSYPTNCSKSTKRLRFAAIDIYHVPSTPHSQHRVGCWTMAT